MNFERPVDLGFPLFQPHRLLRSGHLQTIAGSLSFGPKESLPSTYHEVSLPDGDRLAIFESQPVRWRHLDPSVMMVHGLAGSVQSGYLRRIACRLWRSGVRVVRMNLRGAGTGFGLAKGIYHAGRTEDLRAVCDWMSEREARSKIGLIGFSLGANLVLKLAAEASREPLRGLDCLVAANPPMDLKACSEAIRRPENRIYNRNFVNLLKLDIQRLHHHFPELGPPNLENVRTVYDFDEHYTARRNGFDGAENYYQLSSAMSRLEEIEVDGLVIHSMDDPFIPTTSFLNSSFPRSLVLELIPGGGHLGYLTAKLGKQGRRWLDARVTTWFIDRWTLDSDR